MAASSSTRAACSGASGSAASARARRARREDALAVFVDERLVEPAEADAAGEVADDGEAQLGRDDEPVEHVAGGRVERRGRDRLGSHRWRSDVASCTSGAERCWARKIRKTASSSSGVRSKSVDAVVAQDARELVAEVVRQPARSASRLCR